MKRIVTKLGATKKLMAIVLFLFSNMGLMAQDVPNPCNASFDFEKIVSADGQEIENMYLFKAIMPEGATAEWYFPDNTVSTGKEVRYQAQNGVYTICLVVRAPNCESKICKEIQFGDEQTPQCYAGFSYSPVYFITSPADGKIYYQFSAANQMDNAKYIWTFDGDTIATEMNPMYGFEPNSSGSYNVCLTVMQANCVSTECQTVSLYNNSPCKTSFSYTNSVADCINCYDFTSITSTNSKTVAWKWSFGDGTFSEEPNPMHSFGADGIYEVCLTTVNEEGCSSTDCQKISIGVAPGGCYPRMDWYKSDGIHIPEIIPIVFSGSADFEVAEWYWDFGDSTSSTEQKTTHGYYFLGNSLPYVCLTTVAVDGCKSTACQYIPIYEQQPPCNVAFKVMVMESYPQQYAFVPDFMFNGETTEWKVRWDFGDGETSTEFKPVHAYKPESGMYTACLYAVNAAGCEAAYCETIYTGGGNNNCDRFIAVSIINPTTATSCDGAAFAKLFDFNNNPIDVMEYRWSTGENAAAISNLCANTNYTITAYDVYGCETRTAFVLFESTNGEGKENDWTWNYDREGNNIDFNIDANGEVEVNWDFGDGTTGKGKSISHTYNQDGVYSVVVTVTDAAGNVIYSNTIDLNTAEAATSIKDVEKNGMLVYPNPTERMLTIDTNGQSINELEIYSLTGKQLMHKSQLSESQIDVSFLQQGIYLMKVKTDRGETKHFKFVKQ